MTDSLQDAGRARSPASRSGAENYFEFRNVTKAFD